MEQNPRVTDEIGAELARWGKVVLLETRGRVSGRSVRTAVGYVEDDAGELLVAAGNEDADWVLNLRRDARCTATIGERRVECKAIALEGPARAEAIVRLILKYGTSAERLGAGPAFRLVTSVHPRR